MGTSISAILQVTTPALGVAPGPVTGLVASSISSTSLSLSWTAPATGGTPFAYQPQVLVPGGTAYQNLPGGTTGSTTQTVSGLLPNSTYSFQILTTNATGSSLSNPLTVTTSAVVPGAPTGLAVVGTPGTNDISLQWIAPAQGSAPITYQIASRTPSGSGSYVNGPTTTALALDVTGLASGASFDFIITASNGAGSGPASAALLNVSTASPTNVLPSAPLNLAQSAVTQSTISVTWTAPVQGTAPLSYVVQYRPH